MKKKLKKKIAKMIDKTIVAERNRPRVIMYSPSEHLKRILDETK